jgi:hypothetical protein
VALVDLGVRKMYVIFYYNCSCVFGGMKMCYLISIKILRLKPGGWPQSARQDAAREYFQPSKSALKCLM